jgi:hypothetical protein
MHASVNFEAYKTPIMKKEFENFRIAISWIAEHAITQFHLEVLKKELTMNHRSTGRYFIYTIIFD